MLSPTQWTPPEKDKPCPLLAAVNDSRKGQAELSLVLGERVRQAAELLIQAYAPVLNNHDGELPPQDIYRAAVRMIMRMVVVLFAESREGLLPRDTQVYHSAYSLQGLRELLERISPHRLRDSFAAYPRILSLLGLIYHGCSHEAMLVPAYGGELFAPGHADDPDGMKRALHLFETACFEKIEVMNDLEVRQILDLLTRTRVKIRQGRTATWITAPVDFSGLGSEYIGILYEGLLDFELRCAAENEPIIFLAIGNQPALPLSTLEQMDGPAIKNLLEKLKDTSSGDDEEEASGEEVDEAEEPEAEEDGSDEEEVEEEADETAGPADGQTADDPRYTLQARAEQWARRACEVGGLVSRPRGRISPERQMRYEQAIVRKARQLVPKVVLPGEWYLVRWGGTRKGSGSFYTRPQLAIPTVHRTLRPLAYDPPAGAGGTPDTNAPADKWTIKKPEEILKLQVCDPACGSGSFCLGALRFLTNALYESLLRHQRIHDHGGKAVLDLIYDEQSHQTLACEALPCRPDDDPFEVCTKAILRRYVVERCIYGVDLDPLAVELCRLSLWIETLDHSLPLTFLNHKIKVGNSLVGAWIDQFLHYPVMAWEREGGDKNHTSGVHFEKEAWTKAIKEFAKRVRTDLIHFIDGARLFYPVDLTTVRNGHAAAEAALKDIHNLGIVQVNERAEKYEAMVASREFQNLKEAFDLWCALWFWPADQLAHAPLPTQFAEGQLSDIGRQIVHRLANRQRFFHWELEFPDVFNPGSQGFDAVLGNPPWENLQPNPEEFHSAFDPLFRTYGQVEKKRRRAQLYAQDEGSEHEWLVYCDGFKAFSNWVGYVGAPFGNRITTTAQGAKSHDLNLGDRGRNSFTSSERRHEKWKQKREESSGYADQDHPYSHQLGRLFSYKLFLEHAHSLLKHGGRLGMIVPSGLYSDAWSQPLRRLFLDECSWEWLFGFENREKIFDIDSRFKFNPVIVAKGGQTTAIRAAFMRRDLSDWEKAELYITDYPRQQIVQFSPRSLVILELQTPRDLEVMTSMYSRSTLLGDEGSSGWGLRYHIEYMTNTDAELFPPMPTWTGWDYRPDEYGRWIKGPWKPVAELWGVLGVKPLPADERRCAQPPYDKLPILRADIPAGLILSRDASHFVRETDIPIVTFTDTAGRPLKIKIEDADGAKKVVEPVGPAVALPLYEGRMTGQYDFSEKGWVSGKGRSAKWREIPWDRKQLEPQYLIGEAVVRISGRSAFAPKVAYMRISSATNARTMIATYLSAFPACDSVFFYVPSRDHFKIALSVAGCFSSLSYDYGIRVRLGGLNVSDFVVAETAVPSPERIACIWQGLAPRLAALMLCNPVFSADLLRLKSLLGEPDRTFRWALTDFERLRVRCIVEAIMASSFGLTADELRWILRDSDRPIGWNAADADRKGLWRVQRGQPPERRLTVLTFVAFQDLQEKTAACDGDIVKGIEAFCNQNNGEGWMLPETLRLADYGLGHDDRAKEHQTVRECFGPRFHNWQLAQSPEESWKECHLHARNLLGEAGYRRLLDKIEGKAQPEETPAKPTKTDKKKPSDGMLFDTTDMPLFRSEDGG